MAGFTVDETKLLLQIHMQRRTCLAARKNFQIQVSQRKTIFKLKELEPTLITSFVDLLNV